MASHVDAVPRAGQSALYVARSPEGQAAAKRPAAAPSLTSEQAKQQAQAEGLTLRVAKSKTGYYGVPFDQRAKTKPYPAQVWRGGKQVTLGTFATAEEAALCIARSPEGRAWAAAQQAAASEERNAPAMPPGAVLKEEGAVPPMPPGAFVKEEQVAPPGALVKEEGVVPPMPPDAVVKQEREVVVKQETSQDGRGAKRQRKAV